MTEETKAPPIIVDMKNPTPEDLRQLAAMGFLLEAAIANKSIEHVEQIMGCYREIIRPFKDDHAESMDWIAEASAKLRVRVEEVASPCTCALCKLRAILMGEHRMEAIEPKAPLIETIAEALKAALGKDKQAESKGKAEHEPRA